MRDSLESEILRAGQNWSHDKRDVDLEFITFESDDLQAAVAHSVTPGDVGSEFILRLHAGSVVAQGVTKLLVDVLRAFPTVGFCYLNLGNTTESALQGPVRSAKSWNVWAGHDWLEREILDPQPAEVFNAVMFRTRTLQKRDDLASFVGTPAEFYLRLGLAELSSVAQLNVGRNHRAVHLPSDRTSRGRKGDELAERRRASTIFFSAAQGIIADSDRLASVDKMRLDAESRLASS